MKSKKKVVEPKPRMSAQAFWHWFKKRLLIGPDSGDALEAYRRKIEVKPPSVNYQSRPRGESRGRRPH